MASTHTVVQGTLSSDGTLKLDALPNLPPGRVRVVLHLIEKSPAQGQADWWGVLQEIRKEQEARDYQGRSKEQIDADLGALRDEWEERLRDLEKIHEAGRKAREQPGC